MQPEELKQHYDVGYLTPFYETGILVQSEREKTAEENGRDSDIVGAVMTVGHEESPLIKTAAEFGHIQALRDLGIMRKKDSDSMEKTASENGVGAELAVIKSLSNFIREKNAAEEESTADQAKSLASRAGDTLAEGAGRAGGAALGAGGGAGLGAAAGGIGGAGLGALGGYLMPGPAKYNVPIGALLGGVGGSALGTAAGGLGGAAVGASGDPGDTLRGAGTGAGVGAGVGALGVPALAALMGGRDRRTLARLAAGGGLAGGTAGAGLGALIGREGPKEAPPALPAGY